MAVDDGYTKTLLHLNGTDAGTTITDESGKVWSCYGNAQLDTAQKKFGTASALFDNALTSYIETAFHPDFDLGNSDFTIDFWIRFSTAVNHRGILEIGAVGPGNANGISLWYYHTDTTLRVVLGSTTSNFTWVPVVSTWYHVAVCRTKGTNNLAAFINGALVSNQVNAGAPTIATHVIVGTDPNANNPFYGWIDELRISNTVRWTNTFIPPTAEYSAAVPSLNANISFSPSISMQILRGNIGDIAANISFSPRISGTIDYVPPPQISANISFSPSVSGTMDYSIIGTTSLILPMLTLSATGGGEYLGNAEIFFPILTLSSEGYDNALGEGNLTLPMFSLLSLSQANELGEAALTLPRLRLSAEGGAEVLGYGSIILPMLVLSTGTLSETIGEASISVSLFKISGEGASGAVGDGAITIPVFVLSTSAYMSAEGTANLIIPMLALFAENLTAATDFLNLVMNVRNNALTLYSNYPFNSLCRFNGKNLGATATGIYDLDSGDTDDGSLIEWNFRTGYLDLEQKMKKKITQAWMSYKSDGDLIVTIVQPNGEEYEYPLSAVDVTESGIRAVFGKGIKSKYVAVDIKNVDGCSITLDVLRLQFDQFTKKR